MRGRKNCLAAPAKKANSLSEHVLFYLKRCPPPHIISTQWAALLCTDSYTTLHSVNRRNYKTPAMQACAFTRTRQLLQPKCNISHPTVQGRNGFSIGVCICDGQRSSTYFALNVPETVPFLISGTFSLFNICSSRVNMTFHKMCYSW